LSPSPLAGRRGRSDEQRPPVLATRSHSTRSAHVSSWPSKPNPNHLPLQIDASIPSPLPAGRSRCLPPCPRPQHDLSTRACAAPSRGLSLNSRPRAGVWRQRGCAASTSRRFRRARRGAVQCSAPCSDECSGFKTSEQRPARRITRLRTRRLGFASKN
jgi:hypothetical protein